MPDRDRPIPAGLRAQRAGQCVELTWYAPHILRVRAAPGRRLPPDRDLALVARPDPRVRFRLRRGPDGTELRSSRLRVRLRADGGLDFADRAGRPLLREDEAGRSFPANALGRRDLPRGCAQRWLPAWGEALYGLGQHQDGRLDWRGRACELLQSNCTVAVPFLWSTGGWGLLWNSAAHSRFSDGSTGMELSAEAATALDYCLVADPRPDALVAGYRLLTGAAPLLPRWALGFWQSRERYRSAGELAATVEEFRRRRLPLDVIVQDWCWWGGEERWSSMEVDPAFGDLAAATARIRRAGAHTMISIWPMVGPRTALARALRRAGGLFRTRDTFNRALIYDPHLPAARDLYWKHAERGLWRQGVDGWWMDGTEPEFGDVHRPLRNKARALADRDSAAGPQALVLNAYSLATTGGVHAHQRAADPSRRVCILTRSAFSGQQRHAAITWSGDISASWECLRRQVAAGLDFCMSGIPWWTTDAGAFFTHRPQDGARFPADAKADPAYRELYLRWMQWAALCPVMRSHGTQTEREPWFYGGPGHWCYDGLAGALRLRYRLLPYLEALMAQAAFAHGTPMRGLAMDFGADPRAHRIADQFMLGPALLACPLLHPVRHAAPGEPCGGPWREAWLPEGAWTDFWTGRRLAGGGRQRLEAPLARIPLLLRAGSILPLGPDRQHSGEDPHAPLELRIAPGADGAFALYEDAGDGYGYERGQRAWIPLAWDARARVLTIGARRGRWPGMPARRVFRAALAGPAACGLEPARRCREVEWRGRELRLRL